MYQKLPRAAQSRLQVQWHPRGVVGAQRGLDRPVWGMCCAYTRIVDPPLASPNVPYAHPRWSTPGSEGIRKGRGTETVQEHREGSWFRQTVHRDPVAKQGRTSTTEAGFVACG